MFCGACSSGELSIVNETEERQFKLAKEFQSQGRYEDALITYLGLISIRRESPESHLEVGYIYLNTLKDPVRAIFYFGVVAAVGEQMPGNKHMTYIDTPCLLLYYS